MDVVLVGQRQVQPLTSVDLGGCWGAAGHPVGSEEPCREEGSPRSGAYPRAVPAAQPRSCRETSGGQ